jgi:hypothetical protein
LYVPKSRVPLCRISGPFEPGGATGLGGLNRRPCVGISNTSPKIRPWATLELPEVLNLHYPLAALTHELQLAVEVENLNAVAASFKDTAQHVVVSSQAGARSKQFYFERLNG